MRLRVAVVLLLAVLLGSRVSADDWSLPNINKQVLRLETAREGGAKGTCSSVIFAPGLALTAAHCTDSKDIALTLGGRHATLERSNRILDLAVVKFAPRSDDMPIPLRSGPPSAGEAVAAVGFPFAKRDLAVQIGHVAVSKDEHGYMVVNVDLIPGDSGGPVLDKKGRLVGIISAVEHSGPAHQGLVVELQTIRDFIFDLMPAPKAKP